jgi:hypothetical protein
LLGKSLKSLFLDRVRVMVRCQFCGGELEAEPLKIWRFRFY